MPPTASSKLNALITRFRESYSSMSMSCESKRLKKSSSEWLNSGNALIQHLSKKMQFLCLPVLPGSAEAKVIWCGIVKHLLIAYFIGNTSAKKYRNPFTCVKVIVSQRWDFFQTQRTTVASWNILFLEISNYLAISPTVQQWVNQCETVQYTQWTMSCIDCAAGELTPDTFTLKWHSYRPSSSGRSDVLWGLLDEPTCNSIMSKHHRTLQSQTTLSSQLCEPRNKPNSLQDTTDIVFLLLLSTSFITVNYFM